MTQPSPFARYQHEPLTVNHLVGNAKYVEQTMQRLSEQRFIADAILGAQAKRKYGWRTKLMWRSHAVRTKIAGFIAPWLYDDYGD